MFYLQTNLSYSLMVHKKFFMSSKKYFQYLCLPGYFLTFKTKKSKVSSILTKMKDQNLQEGGGSYMTPSPCTDWVNISDLVDQPSHVRASYQQHPLPLPLPLLAPVAGWGLNPAPCSTPPRPSSGQRSA